MDDKPVSRPGRVARFASYFTPRRRGGNTIAPDIRPPEPVAPIASIPAKEPLPYDLLNEILELWTGDRINGMRSYERAKDWAYDYLEKNPEFQKYDFSDFIEQAKSLREERKNRMQEVLDEKNKIIYDIENYYRPKLRQLVAEEKILPRNIDDDFPDDDIRDTDENELATANLREMIIGLEQRRDKLHREYSNLM